MGNVFMSICKWIKTHLADLLTVFLVLFACIAAFGVGYILCLFQFRDDVLYYETMISAPEPRACVLCRNQTGTKIHAPCIVNLATGEVAELSVYAPHPTDAGEVTAAPKKGYTSFFTDAGAMIQQNPDLEYCEATLPRKEGSIDPGHFCYECRRILAEPYRNGYVIADMYNPEAVEVYTVWDGAKYEIRDYLVTVNRTDSGALEIEVHGLLDENTAQDQ